IRPRPFFAFDLGDLAQFGFVQPRPAFDQRGNALSPILARARFDASVIVEILQMNGSCFAEGHFSGHLAIPVSGPLPMLFHKLGKFGFSDAEV
ncbi:MAG TPA: hypothetical protein VJR28_05310, partial [Chthoniobacterales bacterium]|nr:hypothetical protein [Chthoniobacterales bacterium]